MQCEGLKSELATALRAEAERGLRENPLYDYAVSMGQLDSVEIAPLRHGESAERVYERRYLALGQGPGKLSWQRSTPGPVGRMPFVPSSTGHSRIQSDAPHEIDGRDGAGNGRGAGYR